VGGAAGAAGSAGAGGTAGKPSFDLTKGSYLTADQMLLANEINESGEPFAEALGYNLDKLDPDVPDKPDATAYTLGIENYEYSRYQLGTVISRSGIGLHMMWAPMIAKAAAAEPTGFDGSMTGGTPNGVRVDDELVKNVKMFVTLSNHTAPGNPWPQFAEFRAGDPHLPQAIDPAKFAWEDFSTLRWDRSKMDKVLNPAAMGQTLMKQYLWAQDMLGSFHDGQDNGVDATGKNSPDLPNSPDFDPSNGLYYGGDSLDGFVGMVLTAEAINKVAFLTQALAYDGTKLGSVDLASYDPKNGVKYFPHGISVTEGPAKPPGLPPKATALSVTDDSSSLFDQASMLWGTGSFTNMMDPSDTSDAAHLAYREVFDGSPFPASKSESGKPGSYDLMKGTSKAIFMNLQAMHFDPTHGVFVSVAHLSGGKVTRDPKVDAVGAAYLVVALERFVEEFAGTPLEAAAKKAVTDQATFISKEMSDGNGGFYDDVTLGTPNTHGASTIVGQAAAVRALYVAHRVTGNSAFLDAANAGYLKLIGDYYVPTQRAFRSTVAQNDAVYSPQVVALIAGAMREASLEGGQKDAATKYTDFFQTAGSSMQLSEGANTGEHGSDSDGDGIPFIPEQPDRLPPVFATKAVFHLVP